MKKFLFSFLVSLLAGVGIATACALPLLPVAGGLLGYSLIPKPSQVANTLNATVFQEVWTKQVKEELTRGLTGSFLDGIEDFSRYVNNAGDEAQVIHLVYMGVEPAVLINNNTYPIPITALGQDDIVISLDKLQTEVTPITDDELYALSYDKIQVVKNKHSKALLKTKIRKSIHALAPAGATAAMPVLLTTGADDGTGRRRLTWADLVKFKAACDEADIPDARRLVLCDEHANDLLLLDQKFKDQFYNATSGKPYSQLGFEFYQYNYNPYYTVATGAKKAFGAVPVAGDRRASVMFTLERAAKAEGWTKMYYSEAKTDPENQRNLVNFRHYFVVMPTREEGRGAIISASV